jgi:hypothetical protein
LWSRSLHISREKYLGDQYVAAGFLAYAIHNIHTIDYYLIRSYLHKFGEDRSVHMVPVNCYDQTYTDYIFERVPPASFP